MAVVSFNVPPEVIDSICSWAGYDPAKDGAKGAFAKQAVISWLRSIHVGQQATAAAAAASDAAATTAKAVALS